MDLEFSEIVENINDVVTVFNLNLEVIYVSPSVLRLRGFTPKEAMKHSVEQITGPDAAKVIRKILEDELKLEAKGTADPQRVKVLEAEEHKKDGSTVLVENRLSFWRDKNLKAKGIIDVSHDITERKLIEKALWESEKKYRELSIIDDLSQLFNSRHFHDQIKLETERINRYGQSLTLLMLDLDDFKSFNDTYGHVEGDQVLMRLGQVVKKCLREIDSAYRYGGEEFTIILPVTTSSEGIILAERIRKQFKEEVFSPVPGQEVHLTMSVGVAQYKSGEDVKIFVHRADQRMYQAKKSGKDRVCSETNCV